MKRILLLFVSVLAFGQVLAQQNIKQNEKSMKLNAGIITSKMAETKAFYTKYLNFNVTFENEFYLLMSTPNGQASLSFLLPNHPTQQALFQSAFQGQGMYLTIEVENVDELYEKIKKLGANIEIDLRDEPWGDRHFAIKDPNGIGIDLVTYSAPSE